MELDLASVNDGKPELVPSYALANSGWPCIDKKMMFAWNTAQAQNQVTLPGDDRPTSCNLELSGFAFPGRSYELELGEGEARADPEIAGRFIEAMRETRRGTIQVVAGNASFDEPGYRPILRLGTEEGGDLISIGQVLSLIHI